MEVKYLHTTKKARLIQAPEFEALQKKCHSEKDKEEYETDN